MTKDEIAYIIEWLYIHNGEYASKTEWTESFVKMLYSMTIAPPLKYNMTDKEINDLSPGKVTKKIVMK